MLTSGSLKPSDVDSNLTGSISFFKIVGNPVDERQPARNVDPVLHDDYLQLLTFQYSVRDVESFKLVASLQMDQWNLINTKRLDKHNIDHYSVVNQLNYLKCS